MPLKGYSKTLEVKREEGNLMKNKYNFVPTGQGNLLKAME